MFLAFNRIFKFHHNIQQINITLSKLNISTPYLFYDYFQYYPLNST